MAEANNMLRLQRTAAIFLRVLSTKLGQRGFDIFHPFPITLYNERVATSSPKLKPLENFRQQFLSNSLPNVGDTTTSCSTVKNVFPPTCSSKLVSTTLRRSFVGTRASSLGYIVGCSKMVWPFFQQWVRDLPLNHWKVIRDPFWEYVQISVQEALQEAEKSVSEYQTSKEPKGFKEIIWNQGNDDCVYHTATHKIKNMQNNDLPFRFQVYWSWQTEPGKLVAMQRLAAITELSLFDSTSYLCLHPRFGAWHSMQCVIALDMGYNNHIFTEYEPDAMSSIDFNGVKQEGMNVRLKEKEPNLEHLNEIPDAEMQRIRKRVAICLVRELMYNAYKSMDKAQLFIFYL